MWQKGRRKKNLNQKRFQGQSRSIAEINNVLFLQNINLFYKFPVIDGIVVGAVVAEAIIPFKDEAGCHNLVSALAPLCL